MIGAQDGSQWLIQAANDDLGVSQSVSLGLIDEAWRVRRDVFEQSLEPTGAEAEQSQMYLVSTAGVPHSADASDLMPVYRGHGLAQMFAPQSLLMLEWSAPLGCDIDVPAMWRLASPHWTEARAEIVAENRAKAPTAPAVETFGSQWLNQWRVEEVDADADRLVPEQAWGSLYVPAVPVWSVAAIEAAVGSPPVVALAGTLPDGRVVVSVAQALSVADAAGRCPPGVPVLAGKSLCGDPALAAAEPRQGTISACLAGFQRLVSDGVLAHDGGEILGRQLAGVRVVKSATGPRAVSPGRVDAIKAAFWAAESARVAESPGVF
jgi:phage terminase large subunit-like protein